VRVSRFRATNYGFVRPKFPWVKYGISRKFCSLLNRYLMENRAVRSDVIWQEQDTDHSRPISVEVKEFMGVC
jgi:hypothetical protein